MLKGKSTSLNIDRSFLWGEKQQWWTLLNALSIVSVCKMLIKLNELYLLSTFNIEGGGILSFIYVFVRMHTVYYYSMK